MQIDVDARVLLRSPRDEVKGSKILQKSRAGCGGTGISGPSVWNVEMVWKIWAKSAGNVRT
jgi:hypothetical protein